MPTHAMHLTKTQLSFLKMYQRLHADPPTALGLLWLGRRGFLSLLPAAILGVLFILTQEGIWILLGYFLVGLFLGACLRDIGRTTAVVRLWPAVEQIVHWERVDQIVDENENDAA